MDTLQRALQHARSVSEEVSKSHEQATKRVHAHMFGGGNKDARPLVRKLMQVGAARDKENLG